MDFCADLGVVVEDVCGRRQEVLEVDITEEALVSISVLLKCRPCDFGESWSEMLKLVGIIVLRDCRASGNVVVNVGRLDSLLEGASRSHVTRLEGWVDKSRCHLGSGGDVCGCCYGGSSVQGTRW